MNNLREDLMTNLFGNTQAVRILKKASKNPDLLESIKERASIRWSEGLSDSLYDAVLSNIQPVRERVERDAEGKIILKPVSDWEAELKKYI